MIVRQGDDRSKRAETNLGGKGGKSMEAPDALLCLCRKYGNCAPKLFLCKLSLHLMK